MILALPILLIQTVVAVIFIDRLYGDVTISKTTDIAREVNYVFAVASSDTNNQRLRAIQSRAQPLAISVQQIEPTDISGNRYEFFDISGRYLITTLRAEVPNITLIDLATNDRKLYFELENNAQYYSVSLSRHRATAVNPHQLLVAGALTSFLFIGIAVLFLRNQVKPIRILAKSAEAFGKGDKIPFSPSGAAEVRKAGHAFISMQARIERHLEQRTAMLSGVSHDLRTPLTRMNLSLSLMDEDTAITELKGDVKEMESIVNEFLDFSRGDSGEEFTSIDPKVFIKQLIRDQKRIDHQVALKFTGAKPTDILLKCRKLALGRAISNLLNNAARYAEQTVLTLSVRENMISFIIEDDGPGIAKADRENAIKPFERLDVSRNQNKGTGTGLGLAIVSDIARSHGGQLNLSHSTALGGLKAEIQIPR